LVKLAELASDIKRSVENHTTQTQGKTPRRSRMEIICDILRVIREGSARPTQVMHRANLTWPVLMTHLEALLRHELLTQETSVSRTTYRLTERGSMVLNIYLKLKEEVGPLESETILAQQLEETAEPLLARGEENATFSALRSMRSVLGAANFRLRDEPVPGRSGTKYRFSLVAEGLNKSSYGFDILTHASESQVIRVFVKRFDSGIPVYMLYTKSASAVAKKLAGSYSMELVHVRDLKGFADLLTFHDALLSNRSVLLEADPSQKYEFPLRELVRDETKRSRVSAFTWRGSPLYPVLPRNERVYVYVMTTPGPRSPPARPGEFVVPSHDEGALLELMEGSAAKIGTNERDLVIFDSVSELLVSLGNERSQRFLKRATRSLEANGRRSLFIMKRGYHDETSERMVRGLSSDRLVYDGSGLKLDRAA
jgi:predicted transcriptional regulator